MRILRQLRALAVVFWRCNTRRSFRGGPPRLGLGAATTRLMLGAWFVLGIGLTYFRWAYQIGQLPLGRLAPTALFVDALLLASFTITGIVGVRSRATQLGFPLDNPVLLDPLPLFFSTRLGLLVAQSRLCLAFAIPSMLCLAGTRSPEQWPALAALAIAFALASIFSSALIWRTLWLALPALLGLLGLAAPLAALGALFLAVSSVAHFSSHSVTLYTLRYNLATAFPLFKPVTAFLAASPGSSYRSAATWLGGTGCLAIALLWLIDRSGLDVDRSRALRVRKRAAQQLVANRAESALQRKNRRFAMAMSWPLGVLGLGASVYVSVLFLEPGPVSAAAHLFGFFVAPFMVAQMGLALAWAVALTQAARDLRARSLLASLPITPAMTLQSKQAALWWTIAPVLSWLLPPLVASHGDAKLLWKSGIAATSLVLGCLALPSLAFLSQGLGAANARRGARIEGLLVAIPLFGALAAPSPLAELPSLGALALLAFEARRAAAVRVRWLDDAGDDLERETPVWRALLVLAFFAGLQGLTTLVFRWTSSGATITIAYVVGASGLVLLTLNGRQGLPRLAWIGARRWLIAVGAGVGGAAGLLAVQYAKLLDWFGLEAGSLADAYRDASPGVRIGLAATMILAAPLAEEMFFRGWLQPAIKVELPARWKRFAFVLAAFAFASIHPGLAFPVVFLIGLIAGALFEATGGILAGICAHAPYNAVVTLMGS